MKDDTQRGRIRAGYGDGRAGRVEMLTANEHSEVWAQLTSKELEKLDLKDGQVVHIRAKDLAVVKDDTGALDQITPEEDLPAIDTPTDVTRGLPV